MNGAEHKKFVRQIVQEAVAGGLSRLDEVLPLCEGADPELVTTILQKEIGSDNAEHVTRHFFRARVAEFFRGLPAPNPEYAQWWFDIDTVERVTVTMAHTEYGRSKPVLCLGAPTVAYGLALRGFDVTVLDPDQDILDLLDGSGVSDRISTKRFNARHGTVKQELPNSSFHQVFTDPPWYRPWFASFLTHSSEVIERGGHVFCTLLPRLTRTSAERDRSDVVTCLIDAGFDILAVDRGCLGYVVPKFEHEAYSRLDGFGGAAWRRGDLIHAQASAVRAISKSAFSRLEETQTQYKPIKTFRRKPATYRVFTWTKVTKRASSEADRPIQTLEKYGTTVSARGLEEGLPDVWSSEKCGLRLRDDNVGRVVRFALDEWQKGKTREETEGSVNERYPDADDVISVLDEFLELWGRFETPKERDVPSQEPATAKAEIAKREHDPNEDPYRDPFSRDRDRVVWSTSLRKLANKTQVFPAAQDDNLRQRLAHSIEVMQLATTIGYALELNVNLIEAGALAHDIGHTPFGHAGEHAIHFVLATIHKDLFFNHYEHGVDVVRFLEEPYQYHPGYPGLNLTQGTIDCIFKHIFWHRPKLDEVRPCGSNYEQTDSHLRPPNSLEEMLARSKHQGFINDNYSHPEGQAVRLADKISYLISDIEDGIRLGAVRLEDLLKCRLFHRPPIDLCSRGGESLHAVFKRERRNVLKVLMEDAIEASALYLYRAHRKPSLMSEAFVIDHSLGLSSDVHQIWSELQGGRLHTFPTVRLANVRAARLVSELVVAFALMPGLVDESFREAHEQLHRTKEGTKYFEYYRGVINGTKRKKESMVVPPELRAFLPLERTIGETRRNEKGEIEIADLVLAKDYVASLSDSQATQLHRRFLI